MFNTTQMILRKILPPNMFEPLYNAACNGYDVYRHCVDKTEWIPQYAYYAVKNDKENLRRVSSVQKVLLHTMTSKIGVQKTYDVAIQALKLDGAFVECGVARGGCSAVMALVAQNEGKNRKTWLFDSFEGLPPQTGKDGVQKQIRHKDKRANDLAEGYCLGTFDEVESWLFSELKLDRNNVPMIKGWFRNTLPFSRVLIGSIAVLRLDGDWYESTKCCLENLYGNVVKGGVIIIDDYQLLGCKEAVQEYIGNNDVKGIITLDVNGRAYWQK